MNKVEERFGWRLNNVISLIEEKEYKKAFEEYSVLVKIFNRLEGYDDKLKFYEKLKTVGDDLLFKLFKRRLDYKKEEFNLKRGDLLKLGLDTSICELIKGERFEEALKKYAERK